MFKSFKFLAVMIFIIALVTGCSNANDKASEPQQSQNTETQKDSPKETGADKTAESKQLVYAQSIPITFLDTAGMQPQGYPSGYEAAFAIYNGLVKFDENLNFKPDLATEWSVGDDGLTWTFKLREGVQFQDGTPFNADAVVKAYSRMLDKEINVGAYTLWSRIDKVVKKDDYTVQVITKEPYGGLLNVLAHGSALIPSPTAVEKYGKDYSLNPVGTGPYMLEKFDPGTGLVLKRNDNYFGGTPRYEKITFQYVADPSARIAALKSGQADVIDAVPVEFADELKSNPQIDLITKPGLQVFGIGLNQNSKILQDADVRHALNYAINKEAIVKVLFKGYNTVLDSPLAPNTVGHVTSGDYKFNADKAKQLLADAGWKLGSDGILEKNGQKMQFTLKTPEGAYPNDVMIAETIQNQLKTIGVDVKINKVEKSTFWSGLKVAADKTDFDMVLWGYNPSHGDGYIHLDAMYTTNPKASEAPPQWNHIWYSNKQVDQLLEDSRKQVDMNKRTQMLGQAEKLIWDDAPYIWLYSNSIITAKKKNIEGVTVLPVVFTKVND